MRGEGGGGGGGGEGREGRWSYKVSRLMWMSIGNVESLLDQFAGFFFLLHFTTLTPMFVLSWLQGQKVFYLIPPHRGEPPPL